MKLFPDGLEDVGLNCPTYKCYFVVYISILVIVSLL